MTDDERPACDPALRSCIVWTHGELAETTAGPGTSPGGTTGAPPTTGDAPTMAGATLEVMADETTTSSTSTSGTTTDTTGTTTEASTDASSSGTGAPLGPCEELAIEDPVLLQNIRFQLKIPEGPISGDAALAVTRSTSWTGRSRRSPASSA